MTTMRSLLFLAVAITVLHVPRLSQAQLEQYCCVCGPCPVLAQSRVCETVVEIGSEAAACAGRCELKGCQFVEVLDGSCDLHAGECTPSPAPAASHRLLFALGVLLAGCGVYLARRRVV